MNIAGLGRQAMVHGMRILGRGARPGARKAAQQVSSAAQAAKGPAKAVVTNPIANSPLTQMVVGGLTGGPAGMIAQPVMTGIAGKMLKKAGVEGAKGQALKLGIGAVASPLIGAPLLGNTTNAVLGGVGNLIRTATGVRVGEGETPLGKTPGDPEEVARTGLEASRAEQNLVLDGLVDPRMRQALDEELNRRLRYQSASAMLKGDLNRDQILGDNIRQAIASKGAVFSSLIGSSNPYVANF